MINNVSYDSPEVPILLQVLNGAPPSQLMPGGSIIELPRNQVIDLVFTGGNGVRFWRMYPWI